MPETPHHDQPSADSKNEQLEASRVGPDESYLTTQQGVRVGHNDDSLTAGARGPTLMEDFHLREKLTHFDHERIPERVVHARGAGAYGYFQPHDPWLSDYTAAEFLTDPNVRTPVFVRFSTVAGSRGSADTVRDARGFATKFYTRQGNYDLVGNNIPVFFVQDGIKFPDVVHSVKPEPHNEMPQAAAAHDTFWDFISQHPETLHMVMWAVSDRAIPRSFRMMQGFGVHTFRLINARGQGTFVKFHWTPKLGTHSLVWDEAQKIAGKDPDFHRRDLWEAIEAGQHPEWELGVQLVEESREFDFDFDLLDPTKIIPEEEVPVRPVGRLVLDSNPDNFFAETEQIAFHPGNLVPGIDFTNDPLLQARNFSYLDTQLIRLGGPNFAQIPINRPITQVNNNQRDGYGQMRIHRGQTSYSTNTLSGGCPAVAGADAGAFTHYQEKVDAHKIRQRSESFRDHYSQPALFWNSLSKVERDHAVAAFHFELNKCRHHHVRENTVERLNHVDHELARRVAEGIGVTPPEQPAATNHGRSSPALSQRNTAFDTPGGRKVAVLAADGVRGSEVAAVRRALAERGVTVEVLALRSGMLRATDGEGVEAAKTVSTEASVVYDAVLVPGGEESVTALSGNGYTVHFVTEAYKHAKPVAAIGEGIELLRRAGVAEADPATTGLRSELGVVTAPEAGEEFTRALGDALARHRIWERDTTAVPA